MPTHRRRISSGIAIATSALLVAGLSFHDAPAGAAVLKRKPKTTTTKKPKAGVATPTTGSPTTLAPTTPTVNPVAPPPPAVNWAPCGTDVQCGVLVAPLDYRNPANGQTVQLGIARRPARNAAQRIGVLLVNPGGPAGSAFDMVTSKTLAEDMPAQILDRFDVVGLDPRGITRSIPVLCMVNAPTKGDRTDKDREYAQSCGQRSGNVLPYVGTDSSAEDLETLRVAMGEEKITYLGFSYGTYLGGLYAQAHPDRIRAMILDGAVDPTRFGVAAIQDKLLAQERTLNEFFAACNQSSSCGLKASGKDPKTRYEEMLLIASKTGIGAEKINRDALEAITGILLGSSWNALNRALGDLSKGGTASTLAVLDYYGDDSSDRVEDGSFEAISCRDGEWPSAHPEDGTPAERLVKFQAAAPHFLAFADYWANDATCLSWPVPPRPRAALSTTAGDKIVVVGNTLDLRTPVEWAKALNAQLAGSRLVTYDDYVHTATLSGEDCITAMMTSWLVNLTPPASGLVC